MMRLMLLATLALLLAATAQAAPPIPLDAAAAACAYGAHLPAEAAHGTRYIWCTRETMQEHAAAAFVVNTAIAQHGATDVPLRTAADGQLVAVDLRACAPDQAAYDRLVSLWASLSDREPYFHVVENVRVSCEPYKARDGRTYDYRFERRAVAAPHLLDHGIELEQLAGNPLPHEQSFCPIVRLEWLIGEVLGTSDGRRYYDFRGLKLGDDLESYLVSRGASQEQAKRLNSDERAAMISRVTGKARGIAVFQGAGARPSVGQAIIAITDDPLDDTVDPRFDPFRELLDARTNGHEVMVVLPSGWIEYTIWDGAQKLVDEAPADLVADHRIPAPHTRRLHGALSCIRCHAAEDQWQPFTNEVALMLGDRVTVLGDANQHDQHETLQRLASLYSGDLGLVMGRARDDFDRRVFAVCGVGAAEAAQAVASLYEAYAYRHVDTLTALREIGFEPVEGDALGVQTWRHVVRQAAPADPILARYQVSFVDPQTGRLVGLKNTRQSWEAVYADAMLLALPALLESRKEN